MSRHPANLIVNGEQWQAHVAVAVTVDEGTPMAQLVGTLASAQRHGRMELPEDLSADDLERLQRAFSAGSERLHPERPLPGDARPTARGMVARKESEADFVRGLTRRTEYR